MIFENIDKFVEYLDSERKSNPNLRVITTCGGFDPVHVGHVRCFEETVSIKNSHEDYMFVIIANGDGFLNTKKGFIFMPEKERMEILHAFKGVDHVVSWYDGTQNCIGAIEKIRPNIFTKGGDRSARDRIPESDMCDSVGCKVMFGIGGTDKPQSSSWLTSKLEAKKDSEVTN